MKTSESCWITFPTAIGICGLSWNEKGLTSFTFPNESNAGVKSSSTTPPWIKKLITQVKAHLKGDMQDFSNVPVDFGDSSDLRRAVYKAIQKIPAGKVLSYKELAVKIGKPNASRAVGTALGKNPIPLIVPCHRIITSSGKLGGFSASGGIAVKIDLLQREGVCKVNGKSLSVKK
jgi:methylated-DNA-[protein]-cysteine S-methyltransferase